MPLFDRLRAIPALQLDVALTALVLVVQLWPLLSSARESLSWWGYAVVLAATVPLMWRRRAPVVTLIVTLGAVALYDLSDRVAAQPVWYGALVAMYSAAAYASWWPRVIALAVATVGGLAFTGSSDTAVRGVVLFVAAYAVGRAAAVSRSHAAALEERAAQLQRERRIEAERAVERERARIARDMHDILAHAVSLMVVQAEAGPVVVRSDPDRAEATFDAIAASGRDAMTQLRRLLGVLKEDEGQRAPQPTIADLPGLTDQVANPGLAVNYVVTGTPVPLPGDVDVAAYRVTQEALTNIVKHSGATRADIRLDWRDDELMIHITDDGKGASRALPRGGNGLIGIRERAAACHGTASAGPRSDGPGFEVVVRLPLGVAA
ncbi:sensor histidine kinase [Streptosporangium sp. NPDC020145]|uniref:sensor histidine kinase n=1 Tax=Streptosporangium sp. NPDC020145 TaxID=3154694 RepID=UPI00341F8C98